MPHRFLLHPLTWGILAASISATANAADQVSDSTTVSDLPTITVSAEK